MKATDLARDFIGIAQKNPGKRKAILQNAASAFMGLAHDPKYARSQGALTKLGLEFAGAAQRDQSFTMTDFQDLLQETSQAYQEVGDDTMDLIARRRQLHAERDPNQAKQISITPETFTEDATLGRSAQITGLPTAAQINQGILQSQNVAFWQGSKKEAQAMTVDVTLGVMPVPQQFLPIPIPVGPTPILQSPNYPIGFGTTAAVSPRARVYGQVEYGSDGNRTNVLFDITAGRRFTVVGNYIAVTVGVTLPVPTPSAPPQPTQVYTAGASIGSFAASSPAPLINTQYIDNLPIGERAIIAIPLKAVVLLPISSSMTPTDPPIRIDFLDDLGNIISSFYYAQTSSFSYSPIPLPGDAWYVQVTSDSGTGEATNFRLPFQLSM